VLQSNIIEKGQEEMDGVLRKFRISLPEDECVIKLQEYCKFSSTLLKIPVISKPLCIDANCHNNVNHYVETYGGEKISGYYLITDTDDVLMDVRYIIVFGKILMEIWWI
jgi:hypothetical protein